MSDIIIQRGQFSVGNNGGTTSPPTPFSSLANTVVLNTNNRRMQGGPENNGGNMTGRDMSGGIHLINTNTISFDRESSSIQEDCRFAWESWEYTGPVGGKNEFIVRGRFRLTLNGESITQAVSSITNIDNCIPHITGIISDCPVNGADSSTAIAWMSGSGTLNVKRAGNAHTIQVYVTVVEYTGSAWSVKHGRETNPATTGNITIRNNADGLSGAASDVSSWDRAIIYHQFKSNNLNGVNQSIAATSATYEPSTTNSVAWAFHANHSDSGTGANSGEHFVHILENSMITVNRFVHEFSQSTSSDLSVDVSTAGLTEMSKSSVEISRRSSGGGNAYGRGWGNALLTSLSNINLWVHRTGNALQTNLQTINLSNLIALEITDADDEQLDDGETDFNIDGIGFGVIQGSGTVEIGNNSDYSSATRTVQTVTSWTDNRVTINFQRGLLTDGINYIFITDRNGNISNAYEINIGDVSYSTFIAGLEPDHWWKLNNNYEDSAGDHPMLLDNNVNGGSFVTSPIICEENTHFWRLDNENERRRVDDSPNINITIAHEERTMGGWIRLGDIQRSISSIYKEGGSVNNMAILMGYGNVLMAQLADTGDDLVQAYSDFKLKPNRNYHIMFRFSYNETPNEFRLYIDGREQQVTIGNPLLSTNLDTHPVNINFGRPDASLEMGGTDVVFAGKTICYYAQWNTWTRALNKNTEILALFEKGAHPDFTIATGSETNMQSQLNTIANTVRPDAPICIRVESPLSGNNLNLFADNITFEDGATYHIQWEGEGTLNWTNRQGSDAITALNSNGGITNFINPTNLTLTGIVEGSKVLIYDHDTDETITLVDNITTGTLSTQVESASVDIIVVALNHINIQVIDVDTSNGDVVLPIIQEPDRQFFNPL